MAKKLTMRPRRKWTGADIEKMVALLRQGEPIEKVAKALGRTVPAVRLQATMHSVSAAGNLTLREKRNGKRAG
jgi:transposase-like protein